MHLPSLFVILVYVGGYLMLLTVALSLAAGVYFATQIIEEYTRITKRIIRVGILVELVVHALLWLYEDFPITECAAGFGAHLAYLSLLADFPNITLESGPFVLSCVLLILDNVLWFQFFHSDVEILYRYRVDPALSVFAFFMVSVWLIPMAFAVSLTVNDHVLPNAAVELSSRNSPQTLDADRKRNSSRNLFAAVFEYVVAAGRRYMPSSANRSAQDDILSSSGRRSF
jgi:Transmembrane adaptor Erv26